MGLTEAVRGSKRVRRWAPRGMDPAAPASRPSRRWVVGGSSAAIVLLLVVGAVGVFAYLGILPWRGPLDQGPQTGWNRLGFDAGVGDDAAYTLLWIPNPSHMDVTIDSVTPTGSIPNVHVVSAWIPQPATSCEKAAASPASALVAPNDCRSPAQGYVLPAGTEAGDAPRVVVVLNADAPGRYVSKGFDIHYHVGPISYTTTVPDGFVMTVNAA